MRKIFFACAFVLGVLAFGRAQAIGLAVRPSELNIETAPGREVAERLTVSNSSRDAAFFEVYPDALEEMIKISPESFILESSAEREVEVTVAPRKTGRFETMISVVARPVSEIGLRTGAGVKVPLHILSEQNKPLGLAAIGFFFSDYAWYFAGALALFLFFRYFKLVRRRGES